ncbi:MAG: lipoprotein [Sphingopyxis sp.]
MNNRMIMNAAAIAMLALAGCGQRGDLVRSSGEHGPAIPAGEQDAPTAAELTVPTTQARPQRSDEVLHKSEERQDDEYDLPPS